MGIGIASSPNFVLVSFQGQASAKVLLVLFAVPVLNTLETRQSRLNNKDQTYRSAQNRHNPKQTDPKRSGLPPKSKASYDISRRFLHFDPHQLLQSSHRTVFTMRMEHCLPLSLRQSSVILVKMKINGDRHRRRVGRASSRILAKGPKERKKELPVAKSYALLCTTSGRNGRERRPVGAGRS